MTPLGAETHSLDITRKPSMDHHEAVDILGPPGPWVVGGPGRCGKTRLVNMLWENDGPIAGFPLEGLFSVYLKRRFPFFRSQQKVILEEYLLRPRYIDATRRNAEQPIAYFRSPLTELKAALPADSGHQLSLVGWALARFASDNGRRTWAAFDLHPELIYPRLRRHIPGLKLAVMVRDPREAICATMYWRSDLQPGADRDRQFKHSLIMWCLGVQTGRRLARARPGDVFVFDFNALVAGNAAECRRVAAQFHLDPKAVRDAFDFVPDFGYEPAHGFLSPDGRRRQLLSETELAEISILTRPLLGEAPTPGPAAVGTRPRWTLIVFARAILGLGRLAPSLARKVADSTYFPRRYLTRWINDAQRLVNDLRIGLRCYHDAAREIETEANAPPFFVISGAHGVGKTTVLAACRELLDARRIPVATFHHIVDGVPSKAAQFRADAAANGAPDRTRRWWRGLVPEALKLVLVSALDEARYMRGVNRLLRGAASERRLAIGDRYVYDRLVELRLRRRPAIQRAAVRIVCSLMRRPTLAILLKDRPQAIRGRKQELSVDEIGRYQASLAALYQSLGVNFVEVSVNGRSAEAVAAEIAERILETAGAKRLAETPP